MEGGELDPTNGGLYCYAGNNPVRYTDPDGRASSWVMRKVNGINEIFYAQSVKHSIRRQGATYTWESYPGTPLPDGYQHEGYTFYADGTVCDSNGKNVTQIEPIQTGTSDIFVSRAAEAVVPSTLHGNLFGTSYTGPNNPKNFKGENDFQYKPHNPSEYGSITHDKAYANSNAAGVKGALTNKAVIPADIKLVEFNKKNMRNPNTPFVDKVRSAFTVFRFSAIIKIKQFSEDDK